MKRKIRTGVTYLLVLLFVLGAGALVQQHMHSRSNAQASEEARELAELSEQEVPLAELPEVSEQPEEENRSKPDLRIGEENVLPAAEPEFDDPVARSLIDVALAELQAENPDVVGWIIIPDTPISYPILQGEDNEYYLKYNWKKERNSGGSIFMESRNSADFTDFNTLIYGHRMRDSSMFNALQYYEDAEFLAEHPHVYIVTTESVLVYEVFAAGKVTVTDPVYWLITTQEGYKQRMIEFCLENSGIDTDIVPKTTDHILNLSTCTSLRGSDYRWVVSAVRVGIMERTE